MLLDLHVLKAGVWPDGGAIGDMQAIKESWGMLAETLCDASQYWNIFAAGIKNEPFNMYWGEPPAGAGAAYKPGNRFDTAVEEIAAVIHKKCPRWLIFAQGVGQCQGNAVDAVGQCKYPSAPGHQDVSINAWWGENLQNAEAFPIKVGARIGGKVVYSPHTYGPATHEQTHFSDSSFPNNMPHIWDTHWGYLNRKNVAPVVVGEYGGRYTTSDKVLQDKLIGYLKEQRIGSFCERWLSSNPGAGAATPSRCVEPVDNVVSRPRLTS
eukprot:2149623-Prymnesium_polylepis.1